MERKLIKVYARSDDDDRVNRLLNSVHHQNDILQTDIFVDEGYGDNYAYPHIRYTIMDDNGCHNYKIADGKMVECTLEDRAEEMAARPKPKPTETEVLQAQLQAVTERNDFIEDCISEMAMQIYS